LLTNQSEDNDERKKKSTEDIFNKKFKIFGGYFHTHHGLICSLDSQPTWPLGKRNAGLPQSCLALILFCFMDYIYDQLTQLLQNETTLFKIFLVFVFFFVFFIVAHTYHRRSIRKQPPSSRLSRFFKPHLFVSFLISLSYRPFKQGHRRGPSNIAFRCSQASILAREGDECNSRTTASSSDLNLLSGYSSSVVGRTHMYMIIV